MADDMRNAALSSMGVLQVLNPSNLHQFMEPVKRINDGEDLETFLTSTAYTDIMTFLLQLNLAMLPIESPSQDLLSTRSYPTDAVHVILSAPVMRIRVLVQTLTSMLKDAPPETGPRRFGNVAFRKWYEMVEKRVPDLMQQAMPENVWSYAKDEAERESLKKELSAYLLGSFGSAQRLDYGTGHELSFLAFLGCIWKLGGFAPQKPGVEERGIVVGIIEPYLELVRKLILRYSLEPAGSHGVWGLDDHSFLPYIFGSAQLSAPRGRGATIPMEGSYKGAPLAADVTKKDVVDHHRTKNMYFAAIGFIYDVKTGAFYEHSPTLYDISGIKTGWAKINKGMVKMYNVEVLSKFPVVQHFPFGSLFRFERDPRAPTQPQSVHTQSQPNSAAPVGYVAATARVHPAATPRLPTPPTMAVRQPPITRTGVDLGTAAPWARRLP